MTDRVELQAADILGYWFSKDVKGRWFEADAALDAELKARFEPALEMAKSGMLAGWMESPNGALALVILLDQISRNIYRGTPDAFAADALALDCARHGIARGFDARLDPEQRSILYMPFMHSERLEDQRRGVELFDVLGLEKPFRYMRLHRDIIARFGRFPHRNAILGRASTPEELAFLSQPNSHF